MKKHLALGAVMALLVVVGPASAAQNPPHLTIKTGIYHGTYTYTAAYSVYDNGCLWRGIFQAQGRVVVQVKRTEVLMSASGPGATTHIVSTPDNASTTCAILAANNLSGNFKLQGLSDFPGGFLQGDHGILNTPDNRDDFAGDVDATGSFEGTITEQDSGNPPNVWNDEEAYDASSEQHFSEINLTRTLSGHVYRATGQTTSHGLSVGQAHLTITIK